MTTSMNVKTGTSKKRHTAPDPVKYERMTAKMAFQLAMIHTWPASVCPALFGIFWCLYRGISLTPAQCILLAAAGVIGAVLLFVSRATAGFAPAVLCLASGIGFMMFVRMVIWPVSDTIYGIDPFPQFVQLVICAVLIVLTLIVSEVALYMRKYRKA